MTALGAQSCCSAASTKATVAFSSSLAGATVGAVEEYTLACPDGVQGDQPALPARTPSGNRSSGLGVVALPELSSILGASEPPGHSSGYTAEAYSAKASVTRYLPSRPLPPPSPPRSVTLASKAAPKQQAVTRTGRGATIPFAAV
eukprot:3778651-Rhodomonas_salina.2